MLLRIAERALSQADSDANGPSVPVVLAPIFEQPAQYQLNHQVFAANAGEPAKEQAMKVEAARCRYFFAIFSAPLPEKIETVRQTLAAKSRLINKQSA